MAVYRRSTRVDAPLEAVWRFHSTVDGLVAVTPEWMHLRVESVTGPRGEARPAVLDAGAEIRLSVRPFGVGPRRAWTSIITDRERGPNAAFFQDRMVDGPLPRWIHTHRFDADDGGTRIADRIEYELPLGPLRGLSAAAWPVFEALVAARHRRTRALLD